MLTSIQALRIPSRSFLLPRLADFKDTETWKVRSRGGRSEIGKAPDNYRGLAFGVEEKQAMA